MRCGICGGLIGVGEPVVVYDDGVAHRFSTSCDWYKRRVAEYDAEVLAKLGVTDDLG